ncbi:MAG TPA: FlgD immunoglobulin-like domain containing protein [bacterium]|nr:FlgD immunoglobulin-like domain containing protein [bacterium]HPR89297.1 FlgD immunoglobulin-like domain containing protein [bacterium]
MQRKIFSLVLLPCAVLLQLAASDLFSQTEQWLNFSCGNNINALAREGDFIWVGTAGGLVQINRKTSATAFYNSLNSMLPDNYVTAIAVGPSGEKWIATNSDKILKISDKSWDVFQNSMGGIPFTGISSLCCDDRARLWVGTAFLGLFRFDGVNWVPYRTSNSPLPSNRISASAIDSTKNLWVGTLDSGLVKFDGNNWIRYTSRNSGLPEDKIKSLSVDSSNRLWIGMNQGGVSCFDGANWKIYFSVHSNVLLSPVTSIAFDRLGNTWIGSSGGGVAKFNGVTWTQNLKTSPELPSRIVTSLIVDDANLKWVGVYYEGVTNYDDVSWHKVNTSSSGLPGNSIKSIAIDDSGHKWIGTETTGAAKFDGINWTLFNSQTGIPALGSTNAILIDSLDRHWFGSNNGLILHSGSQWKTYNSGNSDLPVNKVTSLARGQKNDIWLGTTGGGMARFDGQSWSVYNKINTSLPDSNITVVAVDRSGNKWLGTQSGGLVMFDGAKCIIFNKSNSLLPDNRILSLYIDRADNKWIGTVSGLTRYDTTGWTLYKLTDLGILTNQVMTITADAAERIWLGTYGGGIAVFDGARWQSWSHANSGLPYDYVYTIQIDALNNKWIGTANGLAVFNENGIDNPNGPQAVNECAGYALEFNGKDNYVHCGNDSSLALGKEFTLCAWIYRESSSGDWERILAKSDDKNYDYWMQLKPWEYSVSGGIALQEGNQTKHLDGILGTSVPLNEWIHLAVTYDGSRLVGYMNGMLDKSRAVSGLIHKSSVPLLIGRLQNSYNFNGMIDEVSVWDRALSPQEIRENMHCKDPAVTANLKAHWHFDEGSGNIAWDQTLHKNHGTIYGASWKTSTVPVSSGQSQTRVVGSTGWVEFKNVDLSLNITEKNKMDTVVANRLSCKPLGHSPAGLIYYDSTQYWIIEKFGRGTFKTDIIFYLKKKLPGPHDLKQLQSLMLLNRPSNGDGNWALLAQAAAVADDSITFKGITSTGQMAIGTSHLTTINDNIAALQRAADPSLSRNYPNPFNLQTQLTFSVPYAMEVNLVVYNLKGQQVRLLARGWHAPGRYQMIWDGRDDSGLEVGSGLYFYVFRGQDKQIIEKCTVLK